MPPLIPHPSLPRWIEQTWTWNQTRPEKSYSRDNDNDNPITNTTECYACTQAGIPVFHSTHCGPAHHPEWESTTGSSLFPTQSQLDLRIDPNPTRYPLGLFGPILDPRSEWVQKWNRAFLIARGISVAVDPLFFYLLSFSGGKGGVPCAYVDYMLAVITTVLRTCVDALHLFYLWLQFRSAYVSNESLVMGAGKLVWDPRAIAYNYVRSRRGFWLDVFVILPLPQVVFWLAVPHLMTKERTELPMTIIILTFLFQFLPKIYHIICLTGKMQKVTGYIFGSIWWGFALSVISYLVFSHIVGAFWYILALQRVATCLKHQCERSSHCNIPLSCSSKNPFVGNSTMISNSCLDENGPFKYGNYIPALAIISTNSMSARLTYPIFWGVLNLSCWGNILTPTSHLPEVLYSILVVLIGLLFYTLMVGNFQIFLSVLLGKGKQMQLNRRHVEKWMDRRQLPSSLRRRVRQFERQTWTTFGGDTEMEWMEDLPEGLRRDIKRYLCLDLIRKVPLFHNLQDLILDNICDRIKPLIFSKDEKLVREGDAVKRMIFIVRGRVKRSQNLSEGMVSTSVVEAGGFIGDELLPWSLRRPFIGRLPASSATFTCMETVEAFGLDADNLKYITSHFRNDFANKRLKQITRYHSSNWRSWAAVKIQFAWRRYRMRIRGPVLRPLTANGSNIDDGLTQYAAMFMSLRPHDHLE